MRKFDDLWHTRQRLHLLEQSKYLRYVFNDHLMIAVIFLFGALAYWYSQQLRLITQPLWWAQLLVAAVLLISLTLGHLATLLRPADQIFLLPAEKEMQRYLVRARRYSLLLPLFVLIAVVGVLTPFALRATRLTGINWGLTLVGLLILKDIQLWLQLLQLFDFSGRQKQQLVALFWGIAVVGLLLSVYGYAWLLVLLALGLDILLMAQAKKLLSAQRLVWRAAIAKENRRQEVINRFYNLFVDVPGISSSVHRRKWLDPVTKLLAGRQNNAFRFLFSRTFMRRSEYSNIWLRFCIVGLVLIFAVKQPLVLLIIVLLFLFLTGYQLLPLYRHFDHNALIAIFPTTTATKQAAFIQVMTRVLAVEWVIDNVAVLISLGVNLWSVAIVLVSLALLVLLLRLYLPLRLKQRQKGIK
ncbi:ABC transporter permease [Lapidilactobacillus bayanensis]|uniref:ABC transporter permease n=1 Tax=Lapidilactobacillus bayanensis TaxID=2485998 RepID=UPI0013DD9198|nr:ABC transporter permease [Lapidilactobacillus bayanensis]